MKKALEDITKVLFGSEELSNSIYKDTHIIDELTQRFNHALEIRKDSREALTSTHISETVIAPLAFYGVQNKPKYDFVYMQLTPKYEGTKIHLEKQSAGDHWKSYYDFYTSHKVFDFLKEGNLGENRNLSKLIFALYENHELGKITLEDISKKFDTEKTEVLSTLLEGKSILLPHIVPFHSPGFETNANGINHLRETIPSYDQYLTTLLDYIKTNTEDNGIIMSNGFADSRVIHSLLDSDGATLLLENQLFSFMKWDTKFALLFNDQLISRLGLRSDFEIDKIVSIVRQILENNEVIDENVQELKVYSDALIEKRMADEFKDRGQRITGQKVKGIKSKGLRVKTLTKKY